MVIRTFLLFILLLFVSGCATHQNRYTWSGYDDKLYNYYKNPTEADNYLEGLQEVVQKAEASGKVPPGIYAEYGYALYEHGRFEEAVTWFGKERDTWPESKVLMDRMIKLVANRTKSGEGKASATGQPAIKDVKKENAP